MAILAPSPSSLQKLIKICEKYGVDFDIIYNSSKSVCMCITGEKIKRSILPIIYLNGNIWEYVTKFKYLGVYITSDLCDDDTVIVR